MVNNLGKLEGILFTFGDEGVPKSQIIDALSCSSSEFEALLIEYKQHLDNENRGLSLLEYDDNYKLITKASLYELIGDMLAFNKHRQLSQAALETLAIIAYKQPITRLEIEEIRGVNSDMMCRRLEALDLIKEAGRQDSIGRPILYEITTSFLDVFKLTSLDELPEIKIETQEESHDFFR